MNQVKIIRLQQVMSMSGLARSTVYAKILKNEFPMYIKLGGSATGWIESEVIEWVNKRIEERDLQIKSS